MMKTNFLGIIYSLHADTINWPLPALSLALPLSVSQSVLGTDEEATVGGQTFFFSIT